MKLVKKTFVEQLQPNTAVDDFFVVTSAGLKPYSNGKFLTLRLADRTGKVNAVLWEGAEEAETLLKPGTLAHIRGRVGRYKDALQITLTSYEPIEDRTAVRAADFLPTSPTDPAEALEALREFGRSLTNPHLALLWKRFFDDGEFVARFQTAPAGKKWHHAYVGGLLEHTLTVVRLSGMLADAYPDVDRELVLTAALFHDVGKVEELSADLSFDYTDEGRLVGHLFLGLNRLKGYIDGIPGFPPLLANPLLHAVLAHHGELEHSPVAPMTREALIIHHADNLDAHMNAFTREMSAIERPEDSWTGFVNLISRFLYRGPLESR